MQKTTDPDKAAKAFLEYLHEMDTQNVADRDEQGKAHIFLANHYYIKSDYDASYKHTFKCLEFPEVTAGILGFLEPLHPSMGPFPNLFSL